MSFKVWKKDGPSRSIPAVRQTSLTIRDVSVDPAKAFEASDVIALRSRLALSQAVFAQALNVSRETVRGWEQGKRVPDGASQRLLELAESHPQWVFESIQSPNDHASTTMKARKT
jgi:putative transcriptional regulator